MARKYRPQKFSEVIGQEHVTRTLQNALKSGRVVTHVRIGISGSVTGVNVPDPQYANSEIGQCIAQTIKHWHFPSADSEYETEFPIILQAN